MNTYLGHIVGTLAVLAFLLNRLVTNRDVFHSTIHAMQRTRETRVKHTFGHIVFSNDLAGSMVSQLIVIEIVNRFMRKMSRFCRIIFDKVQNLFEESNSYNTYNSSAI